MRTGNDVSRYQSIANAFTGIRSCADRSVDSAGFTTYEDGDVTATDELTPDKAYLSGFGHGIRRLDGGYQSTCLNHAQSNAVLFVGHGLFLLLNQLGKVLFTFKLLLRFQHCRLLVKPARLHDAGEQ
jgi:hypothetical protein